MRKTNRLNNCTIRLLSSTACLVDNPQKGRPLLQRRPQ
ncbi:hypothetical protein KL86DES1_21406 [uncultured Desulfovibrio sp.]|uniref:Uncharacterized protein n=1 Tax=uncultured Desulfovibrio sp. TaxID=167968 RepID=A0A212L8D5_9BACT|nr:hypothetical protein KL86DES1_21406 [uncultured Desulfovibrio sp.]